MSFTVSWVYKAVDKFSPVVAKLERSQEKVRRSFKKSERSLETFTVKLSKLHSKLGGVGRSMRNFGAVGLASVSLPVAFAGKQMIDAASDAEETKNKFGEIYKGMEAEANAASLRLQKSFMLAPSTAQRMLADTADLFQGRGLSGEQILSLAERSLTLSIDVGSFKNVESERAVAALQKAMLGEREMLKDAWKTSLLEADVVPVAEALMQQNQGMTMAQAKMYATIAILESRNKAAMGDFARTMEGYANASKVTEQANIKLKESFGEVLLPMATKAMIKWGEMADKFAKLSPQTRKIIVYFATFAAILPPLIVLLGLVAMAVGAITLPVLAVTAAVGLAIAAFVLLASKWDSIVKNIMSKPITQKLVALWEKGGQLWDSTGGAFLAERRSNSKFQQPEGDYASRWGKQKQMLAVASTSESNVNLTVNDKSGSVEGVTTSGSARTKVNFNRGNNVQAGG